MEEFIINTNSATSKILIGESIGNLEKYLPANKKVVVITDKNLNKHYNKYFYKYEVIEIETGEKNKTLTTIENIIGRLVECEADRSSFIVGIGGGIVCDITGFVASIYMRGLRFGFVSASLLSQVDASVGGKNGVNYKGFKNMVGVFNQPEFVICDFDMLKTLPEDEFKMGFAEIIKHAVIKDYAMFEFLEANFQKALNYDFDVIHRLVRDSAVIKSKIVMQDEREQNERRKLNYGHTFAHAIEKLTTFNHGQAVSIGMILAAEVSVKKNLLSQTEAERLKKLIADVGLPIAIKIKPKQLFEAMKKDKKREREGIHLILLKGLGNAVVINMSYNELEETINDLRLLK
jgi:3-dehydroquinate synthase